MRTQLTGAVLGIVLIALVILFTLEKCATSAITPQYRVMTEVSRHIDTIIQYVQLPPMAVQLPLTRHDVYLPQNDSLRLAALMRERDSLRLLLAQAGAASRWESDTILASTHDTVHVVCDELLRRALLRIGFADRPVPSLVITDSVVTTREIIRAPAWTIGIGVGVGVGTDGVPRLTASLGLNHTLFTVVP